MQYLCEIYAYAFNLKKTTNMHHKRHRLKLWHLVFKNGLPCRYGTEQLLLHVLVIVAITWLSVQLPPLLFNKYKKAVLSQRWPRNVPYTWCPEHFHDSLTTPTASIPNISWDFVPIHPMNVPSKFEVRSFIRSWDNRGYPKKLGSPWIRPRSLFSKIFNGLLFALAL